MLFMELRLPLFFLFVLFQFIFGEFQYVIYGAKTSSFLVVCSFSIYFWRGCILAVVSGKHFLTGRKNS